MFFTEGNLVKLGADFIRNGFLLMRTILADQRCVRCPNLARYIGSRVDAACSWAW
jgi:hypothetical protein